MKGHSVSVDQLSIGQSLWKNPSNIEIALLKISSGTFTTWCTTAAELVCCWLELDEAVLLDSLDDVDVEGDDGVVDLAGDVDGGDDVTDGVDGVVDIVEDEDWGEDGVDWIVDAADVLEDEDGTDDWDDAGGVVGSVDGVEDCCGVDDEVDGEDGVDGAGDGVEDWTDDDIDNTPELLEWVESPA